MPIFLNRIVCCWSILRQRLKEQERQRHTRHYILYFLMYILKALGILCLYLYWLLECCVNSRENSCSYIVDLQSQIEWICVSKVLVIWHVLSSNIIVQVCSHKRVCACVSRLDWKTWEKIPFFSLLEGNNV